MTGWFGRRQTTPHHPRSPQGVGQTPATTAASPTSTEESARLQAILILATHIATGHAGLDPYDPDIFILTTRDANARAAALICGTPLTITKQPGGSTRIRIALDSYTRYALSLDEPDAPLMQDEPLASRRANVRAPLRLIDGGAQ